VGDAGPGIEVGTTQLKIIQSVLRCREFRERAGRTEGPEPK